MDIFNYYTIHYELKKNKTLCRIGNVITKDSDDHLKFSLNLDYPLFYIYTKLKKYNKNYKVSLYKTKLDLTCNMVDKNVIEVSKDVAMKSLEFIMTLEFDHNVFLPLLNNENFFHFKVDKCDEDKTHFWNKNIEKQLLTLSFYKNDIWASSVELFSLFGTLDKNFRGNFKISQDRKNWGYFLCKIGNCSMTIFGLDGSTNIKDEFMAQINMIIDMEKIIMITLPESIFITQRKKWKIINSENGWDTLGEFGEQNPFHIIVEDNKIILVEKPNLIGAKVNETCNQSEVIKNQLDFNREQTKILKSQTDTLKQALELAKTQKQIIDMKNQNIETLKLILKEKNEDSDDDIVKGIEDDNEILKVTKQDNDEIIESNDQLFEN